MKLFSAILVGLIHYILLNLSSPQSCWESHNYYWGIINILGTHSNYCVRNIAISAESAKIIWSTVFPVLFELHILEFFSVNTDQVFLKKVRLNISFCLLSCLYLVQETQFPSFIYSKKKILMNNSSSKCLCAC